MSDENTAGEKPRFWRFRDYFNENLDTPFRSIDPVGVSWGIDAYYPGWQPKAYESIKYFDPSQLRNTWAKPKRKKIPTFPHSLVPIMCPKGVWEEHFADLFDGHVIAYPCKIDDDDYVEVIVTTIVDLIDMEKSVFRRNTANQIYHFNKIVLRCPSGEAPPIFLCGHENRLRSDPIVDHRFVDICKERKLTGLQFTEVEVL